MKPRLYLLAAGLAIGLAMKWATQPVPPARRAEAGDPPGQGQAQIDMADPLVPPLKIPGLLPPVLEPQHQQPLLFRPATASTLFGHDPRAMFHAHGEKVCASGCAVSNHPTDELTETRFHELIAQYAKEPMSEDSLALETLLYFGRQTIDMLDDLDVLPLDTVRARFLARELTITHAKVSIRVVDQHGDVRASLPPTAVPFDRRHVFDMDNHNVQPLVTSGTVKRVGLYHLWTRL